MSNPFLKREKMVQHYLTALEDGDFSTIDAIWQEAASDAALEQLLFNLHETFPHGQELFTSNWHENMPLRGENTLLQKTANTTKSSSRNNQPPTRPQPIGQRRWSNVVRTLAAILLVAFIVGGFLLVQNWNASRLAKSNLISTVTPSITPNLIHTATPTNTPTPLVQLASLCPVALPSLYQAGTNLNDILVLSQSNIWVVGNFQNQPLALHWNGAQWSRMSVPAPTGSSLSSLAALSPNDIWAVGHTDYGSGVVNSSPQPSHTLIEHWNGARWSLVASPDLLPGTRNDLQSITPITPNDAWAVGGANDGLSKSGYTSGASPLLEHWDGTRWQVVALPTIQNAGLNSAVALNANDVWAVGNSSVNDGNDALPLLIHWDGQSWSQVAAQNVNGGGLGRLLKITADASHHLWTLGFDQSGLPLLLSLNNGTWVSLPVPPNATDTATFYNQFWSISATSSQDIWLAGEMVLPGDNTFSPLVEHWDGHQWQAAPERGQNQGNLLAISVSAGIVWASGAIDFSGPPLIVTTCS